MELLCEYEFDIKHKGNENKVFDVLIRNIHVMYVVAINIMTSYLKYDIIEDNYIDEHYH